MNQSNRTLRILSSGIMMLLLGACNTTPERRLDEPLPGLPRSAASAVPTASPSSAIAAASVPPVEQAGSTATPSPSITPLASPVPELTILSQGRFKDAVHRVSGQAKLIVSAGKRVLRLEDFLTENGPDLYVYLVQTSDGRPATDADFISLGRLRSTSGNQNYEIPDSAVLDKVQSVTIWCKAFSVNFGYAPLTAP